MSNEENPTQTPEMTLPTVNPKLCEWGPGRTTITGALNPGAGLYLCEVNTLTDASTQSLLFYIFSDLEMSPPVGAAQRM